jgi:hypothetical protein
MTLDNIYDSAKYIIYFLPIKYNFYLPKDIIFLKEWG